MDVKFEQSKLGRKFWFEFTDDALTYRAKDASSDATEKIPYSSITDKGWEYTYQNEWWRNVGFLWVAIGLALEIPGVLSGTWSLPFWSILGVGALVYYYSSRVRHTVIEAESAKILVMYGRNHDVIVNTIFQKRKEALKKLYGKVDLSNTSENELRKFEILLEKEIISENEFQAAKKEIEEAASKKSVPSPFTSFT